MDPDVDITRNEILPYWNAMVYGVCSYYLGIGLLKALMVMLVALICVLLTYGSRWVMRGGFAMLALTTLVWIGLIPPAEQWHDIASRIVFWSSHNLIAAH